MPGSVSLYPFQAGITCLLEDMLVSVLMLLASVTTMAEGNREVWEYWGGSCLCVYTRETEQRQNQGQITQVRAQLQTPSRLPRLKRTVIGVWGNEQT